MPTRPPTRSFAEFVRRGGRVNPLHWGRRRPVRIGIETAGLLGGRSRRKSKSIGVAQVEMSPMMNRMAWR